MDDVIVARVLHVSAVLAWIGGVWFVTLVLLPAIGRGEPPAKRVVAFHRIEGQFAPQASAWVVLAGASGFWMTWRMDLWWRFADPAYWWMWAMLLLWALFMLILFVLEPLVIHPRLRGADPDGRAFARMRTMHNLLSSLALVTVAGAVAGSHGWVPGL